MYKLQLLPFCCFINFLVCKKNLKLFFFFKNKVYSFTFSNNLFLFIFNKNLLIVFCLFNLKILNNFFYSLNLGLKGLFQNWSSGLNFIGVGFRFLKLSNKSIILKLGFSHLIKVYFNFGLKIFCSSRKPTKLLLFSPNKFCLSKAICNLKRIRLPDNYKGKGLVPFGEMLVLKKREKFGSI